MALQIVKKHLNHKVLRQIEKIDDTFYTEDITGDKWYYDRYKPYHFAYFLLDDNKIVGYTSAVPIKKELYDALLNKVMTCDVEINPDMFVEDSDYIYWSSALLKDEYRGHGYGSKLTDMMMKDCEGKHICCLTVSPEGKRLAEKYLPNEEQINEDVFVLYN